MHWQLAHVVRGRMGELLGREETGLLLGQILLCCSLRASTLRMLPLKYVRCVCSVAGACSTVIPDSLIKKGRLDHAADIEKAALGRSHWLSVLRKIESISAI